MNTPTADRGHYRRSGVRNLNRDCDFLAITAHLLLSAARSAKMPEGRSTSYNQIRKYAKSPANFMVSTLVLHVPYCLSRASWTETRHVCPGMSSRWSGTWFWAGAVKLVSRNVQELYFSAGAHGTCLPFSLHKTIEYAERYGHSHLFEYP